MELKFASDAAEKFREEIRKRAESRSLADHRNYLRWASDRLLHQDETCPPVEFCEWAVAVERCINHLIEKGAE